MSVLSTVEFYTNEMISDIRFYGEGANNYIELSIYLKFTGNDGATTDVTFKLMSGSSTVEQVVLELTIHVPKVVALAVSEEDPVLMQ